MWGMCAMSTKSKADNRIRLSPRVSSDIARLAKSKATAREVTLEYVIERLLATWVAGHVSIIDDNSSEDVTKAKPTA